MCGCYSKYSNLPTKKAFLAIVLKELPQLFHMHITILGKLASYQEISYRLAFLHEHFWESICYQKCLDTDSSPLLSTYFWEVCCISYSLHHLLSIRMNFGDVRPHSLPGDTVNGKARPVHEKRDPAVFLVFLTGRPPGVVCGSGRGGFSSGTRSVTVGTGAFGPTVSADLGRWAAAAGGAWSGHCSEVFRGGVSPCCSPDQLWLPSIHAQRHVAPRACILMCQNHTVLLKYENSGGLKKIQRQKKWSAIPFLYQTMGECPCRIE